jgi:hypothetical protein
MRSIKVISGETAGEAREVEGDIVIGRESADLVVPDPEVSRRHAVVRPSEDGVEVEDLGSRNGTFVDEQRIDRATTLAQSGTVRVGTTELAVEIALVVAEPDVTVQREIPQPDVTVQREIPQPDVTVQREIPQPDVTVQREIPQPDVTAKRETIPQPDVTAKRETIPQPDVTVQRKTAGPPPASAEGSPPPPEVTPPQTPRELLPLILGGLAAAISVALILALLLG